MEDFLKWSEGRVSVIWNDNYIDREDPVTDFIKLHQLYFKTPYLLLLKIIECVALHEENCIRREDVFLYYEDGIYCTAEDIIDYYIQYSFNLNLDA